ncbi:MAG TPA: RagB/SusD family nutrient uptake outer membrane protein [Flavisolibacter sp.]|nr:RagB/SusD family nutrient uptake outer membrane protein [Flavisolibacter sp.]
MRAIKNIKHLFLGFLFVIMITPSCKKVLDVTPYTAFSDATAFTTPARIEAAMNGVYDAAQSGFYAGNVIRGYPFGAANIEQGEMRGEDLNNDQAFYQVTYESTYNGTTANNRYMFENLYALINRANVMIAGVDDAISKNVISEQLANQYRAESRFLRAMAHHELVINFARPYADGNGSKVGIVYRDLPISSDAAVNAATALPRATVAENYAKILADLDFAEANLPTGTAGTDASTFRATKAAAIALKMRVKLHMQDWPGVITEGNKLVPAAAPYVSPVGGWTLAANPGDPFVLPGTTKENIFSIRNSSSDNAGNNGALGYMLTSPGIGGRGLVKVSPIIYNLPAWLCDDKRRQLITSYNATSATGAYFTTKYKDPTTQSDPAPQIRYAEILLTLAEAEARNAAGVGTRAVELLNAVRNRALASPSTQQYTVAGFATKTDLVKAILDERRIELLAEGKRWGDIHRLAVDPVYGTGGIPAKIGNGAVRFAHYQCGAGSAPYASALTLAAIPYSDFRFIWPIPLSETQTNPNYAQNPGY